MPDAEEYNTRSTWGGLGLGWLEINTHGLRREYDRRSYTKAFVVSVGYHN